MFLGEQCFKRVHILLSFYDQLIWYKPPTQNLAQVTVSELTRLSQESIFLLYTQEMATGVCMFNEWFGGREHVTLGWDQYNKVDRVESCD